ncbi:TGF-beta propeptide [mine drainage metagenome]|uniref:TGF-beta propeptide n=1 Tax=mine drainage metagenome TaxID=410659 RepID=A0A1J5RW11_9ZZZZ
MSARHRQSGFILLAVVLTLTLVAAIAFLLNRAGGMNMRMTAGGLQADSARYVAEAGLALIAFQTHGRNCSGYTDLPATTFGTSSFSATVNPTAGSPVTFTSTATLADGSTSTLTRTNVTETQTTPYTLTLQPGTPGLDTSIRSSIPNKNYGADTSLAIQNNQAEALVQFDLSSIPAGSKILSAQFSLYHQSGGNDTVSAFGLTQSWTEGTGAGDSGATWNTYDGSHSWATAGGDYGPAAGIALTLPAINTWATWDLTAWTSAWLAGIQPNYGIVLVANSGGLNSFVSSDEPSSTTLRPKLDVTFLPPCGWTPPASSVTIAANHDAWLDNTMTNQNHGASTTLNLNGGFGNVFKPIISFDTTGIAPGTVVKSATLRLYVASTNTPVVIAKTVKAFSVTEAWVEGTKNGGRGADGVTWNKKDALHNWATAGGSYAWWAPATAALPAAFTSGWIEIDITALVQSWITGMSPNYGVVVTLSTDETFRINSREATSNQPQLVLTY